MRRKARTKVMSISFGQDQPPRLDGVAARKRVSRSRLVREAVEVFLHEYEREIGEEMSE